MLRILLVLIIFLLTPVSSALACSCGSYTLDRLYEGSRYVFTATVLSVGEDNGEFMLAPIAVTEVLKGELPFDTLRIDTSTRHCIRRVPTNTELLFFLGPDNLIEYCARFVEVHRRGSSLDSTLQLLRDYEAGRISTLTGIWRFSDHNGTCSVWTSFSRGRHRTSSLRIQYRHGRHPMANPDDPRQQPGFSVVRLQDEMASWNAGETHAVLTSDGRDYTLSRVDSQTVQSFYELRGQPAVEFARSLTSKSTIDLAVNWVRDERSGTLDGVVTAENGGETFDLFRSCLDRGPTTR